MATRFIAGRGSGQGDQRARPVLSASDQIEFARTGNVAQRWDVASTNGIEAAAAHILVNDEDIRVLEVLAGNYSVEQSVLIELAHTSPHLLAIVSGNPFAPPDLKESRRLGEHAAYGISRFLDDRQATDAQRASIRTAYERSLMDPHGSETLGVAWVRAVRGA